MKNQVLFSVIVPVYNAAGYLNKCIESVLSQSYSNFELILVNDGSKDSSLDICNSYAKKDSRVIIIDKENGGVVSARQAASEIAKGTHIICVDSDDWIDSEFLSVAFERIVSDDPDVICFGYIIETGTQSIQKSTFKTEVYNKESMKDCLFPKLIYSEYGEIFPQSLWGKVYRSNLFREKHSKLDPRIKIGEDAACVIVCIASASKVCTSSACLYHYYVNPLSATNSRNAFPTDGPKLIHMYINSEIKKTDFDFINQNNRRTVHAIFNVCKSQCNVSNSFWEARKKIRMMLNDDFYKRIVKETSYIKNIKCNIMMFIIKNRLYFLIWIYSILDRHGLLQ